MKDWKEKVIIIAEELEWNVDVEGDISWIFSIFSPEGQDCNIELYADSLEKLIDELSDWCNNFDVSYEAYLWLDKWGHGTNGAPYDMKDVYEDMEWFEDKGCRLLDAIMEIEL